MSIRLDFIAWCLAQHGKPYIWGAKGLDAFDCSGLVTAGFLAVGLPDWRETKNAADLFDFLEPPSIYAQPLPGDLCFWGDPVNHVMVNWGDGRVYGACGGDHTTTTSELAKQIGAEVQFRKDIHYRKAFRGFRNSGFEDYEPEPDLPVPTQEVT